MTTGSATAAAVRAVFTAGMILMASAITGTCASVALWVFSITGEPGFVAGDALKTATVLTALLLVALGAVLAQLKWANRGPDAGTVALRSLLICAAPGAVILVAALAAG